MPKNPAKDRRPPGQIIKDLTPGVYTRLAQIDPCGSLDCRLQANGSISLFWRSAFAGKAARRVKVGMYDSAAAPRSLKPTAKGYSINAAMRAAEALAQAGDAFRGVGGYPALQRAEQEAKQAAGAAAAETRKRESLLAGDVWAVYLAERKPLWGERHYRDHVTLSRAGGEVAQRGTRGRKVTIDMPLRPLLDMPLSGLDSATIEAWAANEARTRPTSARLAWRLLKAFMSWCAEQAEYQALVPAVNPAKSKKAREALGKARVKQDALQKVQLPAWFDAVRQIRSPVTAAYLQTLLLTGARPGEVLALRWEDLNLQWHGITIRDKVEGTRVIPLTHYVSHLLRALPRRNAWVFSSADRDTELLTVPRKAHGDACKVAGIDGLTLHGLRRSFKSLTEWMEVPAGVVAQVMGHKPSATAEKHYTVRPLDLLAMHHEKIEAWILEQAGVVFEAKAAGAGGLRVVG